MTSQTEESAGVIEAVGDPILPRAHCWGVGDRLPGVAWRKAAGGFQTETNRVGGPREDDQIIGPNDAQ